MGSSYSKLSGDVRRSDSEKVICPSYQVFSGQRQREELLVISNPARLCL